MRRCPNCGEPLLDWMEKCPICEGAVKISSSLPENKITLRGGLAIELKDFLRYIPPAYYHLLPYIAIIEIMNKSVNYAKIKIQAEIEDVSQKVENSLKLVPYERKEIEIKPPPFRKGIFNQLDKWRKTLFKCKIIENESGNEWVTSKEVEILSYKDFVWEYGYEFLASWVTPNEKIIEMNLLKDATYEMEKLGVEGTISGYQSKSIINVFYQLWGIYNALKKYGIRYISSSEEPISFENVQRIRLPIEVIEGKGGNCIDLTVTFASAIEAAEMIPYIIILPGHALVGADISPPNVNLTHHEIEVFYKRLEEIADEIKENENIFISIDAELSTGESVDTLYFIPIETTLLPSEDFLSAVTNGKRKIVDEIEKNPEKVYIVDIKKARKVGIEPMNIWLAE